MVSKRRLFYLSPQYQMINIHALSKSGELTYQYHNDTEAVYSV